MEKVSIESFKKSIKTDEIEVFITCSSFEDRCFVVAKNISQNIRTSKNYIFYNANEHRKIISNSTKLAAFFESNSDKIKLDSDNPVLNYHKFQDCIIDIEKLNVQGKILIDITTFTHESLLVLFRLLVLSPLCKDKIVLAYVGAGNYSTQTAVDSEKWLSKGIKEVRTVIGYSGITDPIFDDHLMILVGFEFDKTRELIDQYEYHYVSLGFANQDESIKSNHWKINAERHKRLLDEYPNSFQFNFSLRDPIAAKDSIVAYLNQDKFKETNTVIAPLNNKISTIGAALAAIENEDLQIAYPKPRIYNVDGYSDIGEGVYYGRLDF